MGFYMMDSDVYSISHNVSHIVSDGYLIHSHPFYELYYYVEGDVDYLISGVEHSLKPDTLLIIPPNEFHGIRVKSARTYDRWTVHFDPALLSPARRELLMNALPQRMRSLEQRPNLPANYIENANGMGLRGAFENLDALVSMDESLQRQVIPILLEALLAQLLVCAQKIPVPDWSRAENRPSNTIRQVVDYINSHFTERLTLEMLADRFFISKSHLNLSFRKTMGATVIDYVLHKRAVYARQLLMNGYSVAQVAGIAGFNDYTSLYRAYVKYFGHSPKKDHNRTGKGERVLAVVQKELLGPAGPAEPSGGNLWDRLPATVISMDDVSVLRDE